MSLPRICYLGAYSPDYPRSLILRRGLAHHGVQVIECRVSTKLNSRQRAIALAKQFPLVADQCDIIVLAEFNQTIAWPIAAMAHKYRKKLIMDAFTSVYDSAVHDRATARSRSVSALRYWLIDFVSFHLPPTYRPYRILADTDQHRRYYQHSFRADPARIAVIPVGASREWFETHPVRRDDGCTLVSFYGTYIPLHGIETILRAAHQLRDAPDIHFELIGQGQTYPAMQNLAAQLGLDKVAFRGQIPPDELPSAVARADVCLGIFGTTDKALRVIPNKVYQCLALGKSVISADTPALREAFVPGEHLMAVPPGDPDSLAATVTALATDPSRRALLAQTGHGRMELAFSERVLGHMLLDALS